MRQLVITLKGGSPEEFAEVLTAAASAILAGEAVLPEGVQFTPELPMEATPPTAVTSLVEDSPFSVWLGQIALGATPHKERKALVRQVRELVTACAAKQRSDSSVHLRHQVEEGAWLSVDTDLPAPYEDVRLLVKDVVRVGRLGHDKSYFQLASYMGNAKRQYAVPLKQVQGWQPLVGIPGKR